MKISRILLLSASFSCLIARGGEPVWWQALGPAKTGEYAGGYTQEKLSPEDKAVVSSTHFDEWVDYEDEYVKLRYPKSPLITLEVSKQGAGLRVEGGVCTTVDNSCQQAYVIKAAGTTYGVFLLQPAKWLDDGICLCGPMVHSVYQMRDNCLVRYSLLPGGAVKKAQVLGNGLRLMAFEWTHVSCQREIYEEMVESMHLKLPNAMSEAQLKDELVKRYHWIGKAGWVHPGDDQATVDAKLGTAGTKRDDGATEWVQPNGDFMAEVKAKLEDGHFTGFTGNGMLLASKYPIAGTLSWVSDYTGDAGRSSSDDGDEVKDEQKPQPPAQGELVAALKKLEPDCHGRRWDEWCEDFTWLLEKKGFQDPELVATVVRRSTGRSNEMAALEAAKYPELKSWVAENLKKQVASASTKKDGEEDPEASGDSGDGDAGDLLEWQVKNDAAAVPASVGSLLEARQPDLVEILMDHPEFLTPETSTKLAVQTAELAMEKQSTPLLNLLFDRLNVLTFDHPEAVREQIAKLPRSGQETGDGRDWDREIERALKILE